MRKKSFCAVLLSAGIALSFLGCSKEPARDTSSGSSTSVETTENTTSRTEKATESTTSQTEETTSATPTETPTPTVTPIPSITPRTASHFGEFIPYVMSDITKSDCTEEDIQDYYHFCEAVLAEEETFPCHSYDGYSCAYYTFSRSFFPYGFDAVEGPEENDFHDGIAKIRYANTKEWRQQHYEELKEATERIISEVFREDYSDFEKIIALYQYFMKTYTYDQEMNYSTDGYREVYRPLMRNTGVCNEFSAAYEFLLLQVGVEADSANGYMNEGSGHRWNIVRLDGEYYYVDTTWCLGKDTLRYLLMDQDQRTEHGTEFNDGIELTEAPRYDEARCPITSKKYSDLWEALYFEVDYEHDLIRYTAFDDNGELVEKEFHYAE